MLVLVGSHTHASPDFHAARLAEIAHCCCALLLPVQAQVHVQASLLRHARTGVFTAMRAGQRAWAKVMRTLPTSWMISSMFLACVRVSCARPLSPTTTMRVTFSGSAKTPHALRLSSIHSGYYKDTFLPSALRGARIHKADEFAMTGVSSLAP